MSSVLNEALDEDYKLPRTQRNYKGSDVLPVNVSIIQAEQQKQQSSSLQSVDIDHASASSMSSRGSMVSNDESTRWAKCLNPGERIMKLGAVGKKNNYGMTQTRQLILTSTPRLVYADPTTQQPKGEIECKVGSGQVASSLGDSSFEVKATGGRVFKFTDSSKAASGWVDSINFMYSRPK